MILPAVHQSLPHFQDFLSLVQQCIYFGLWYKEFTCKKSKLKIQTNNHVSPKPGRIRCRKILENGPVPNVARNQTWSDYSTNVIDYDYDYLICSIRITNKQNHNVIDHDYIVSNHDYNRAYICLETSSERKQNPFAQFFAGIFSDNIPCESMQ